MCDANFDPDQNEIAARYLAMAHLLVGLDARVASLRAQTSHMDKSAEYVLALDRAAFEVADETIREGGNGKGFLYHSHEFFEREHLAAADGLVEGIAAGDACVLEADRYARHCEAVLESLMARWFLGESIPPQHFLWTLCITGEPDHFTASDENKSTAVCNALGVEEPEDLDRAAILRVRPLLWGQDLSSLGESTCAELAHRRWACRDSPPGDDWDDWFAAENALACLANPSLADDPPMGDWKVFP